MKTDLTKYFAKARESQRGLKVLNRLLGIGIPFNRPHRLKIVELDLEKVQVAIPYRRSNKNHLNGLHACVLATGAEYATGLILLQNLNADRYRLIMRKLEMDYHYQGKMDANVVYELPAAELENEIKQVLEKEGVADFTAHPKVVDADGNHLATGHIHWQIKDWQKVRTKT